MTSAGASVEEREARVPGPMTKIFFNFVQPIISRARKNNRLDVEDIPVHVRLRTTELHDQFERSWESTGKSLKLTALLRALFDGRRTTFGLTAVMYVVSQGSQLAGPLLLGQIVGGLACRQAEGCVANETRLYLFACGLFIAPLVQAFVENNMVYLLEQLGTTFRNSIMAAIYRKCLVLDNSAIAAQSTGRIVTLMSNDAQKLQDVMLQVHMIWGSPLMVVAIMFLLYREVEWACFVGLGVMLLLVPVTGTIGKRLGVLRREIVGWTDKRTSTMAEVVSGMRVIKFYDWEEPFKQQAKQYRKEEAKRLKRVAWLTGGFGLVLFAGPVFVAVASFASYSLAGNELSTQQVFTALPLFTLLRFPMGFLPSVVLAVVNVKVALRRIVDFLATTEIKSDDAGYNTAGAPGTVTIKGGSFKWDLADDERATTLRNVDLHCAKGSLTMIVGAVGCGKSSLLATLFRQIPRLEGTVEVGGSLAYVPQTAWIMNETVRENILMGAPLDEARYKAALTTAQLATDLEQLQFADLTEIGERGITLSGGQKQRIALARAVYADADVYILDDPLSAVDAHVGHALFEDCLRGALRDKTVLLVTNALQHVHRADRLVWLVDGEIKKQGTYDAVSADPEFAELVGAHVITEGDDEAERSGSDSGEAKIAAGGTAAGKLAAMHVGEATKKSLTGNEDRAEGALGGKVVWAYIAAAGGVAWLVGLVIAYVCEQGAKTFTDYWLILWTEQTFGNRGHLFYIGMYALIAVGFSAITYARSLFFAFGTVRAAVNLHSRLLEHVMRLPMRFFDMNPSGRVINRFSRDTEILDSVLPTTLVQLFGCMANYIGILVFICIVLPWFIVAMPFLSLVYVLLQRWYIPGARELQRLEAVTRSPIYTGFAEAVNGITTIRVYQREAHFTRLEDRNIGDNGLVYLTQRAAAAWLSIRLDFLGLIVLTTSALLMVGLKSIDAGQAGLALTYALDLTKFLKFGARLASKAESDFNSVERMVEYLHVETEAERELPGDPAASEWPSVGGVEVQKACMRYRAGLPLVLKNVSFSVAPGEHIGIVGRTGSGKSSLFLAFFRMAELDAGAICIDGRPIADVGLSTVRRSLSMIPQDPFMFSGTVRRNLDPFDLYSDGDVWQALERVALKPVIAGMDSKLDTMVSDNGGNFSQGQRQLFCLARALLRRSKILMMDEATASVDLDTDVLIQSVVRSEFSDCTVLTIAHRLNTIMDADKVLVMDAGYAAEYDVPHKLLQDQSGIFTSLVNNTGANAARKLRNMASRSYENVADALVDVERNSAQPGKVLHTHPAQRELQAVPERSLEGPLEAVEKASSEMWETADSGIIATPRNDQPDPLSPTAQNVRLSGGGSRFSAGGGSSRLSGTLGGTMRVSPSRFNVNDSILSLPRSPRRSLGSGPLPLPEEFLSSRRERSGSVHHRISTDIVDPEVVMFENMAANITLPSDIESPGDSPAAQRRIAYQPSLARRL